MRRVLAVAAWLLAVAVAAGCAARSTVGAHAERGLDLSSYRTFDWGPPDALPTGDPRLDRDPYFNDHVQGAVEKQLAARGLELATSAAPDLLLHYHASITQRIDVNRADLAYGVGRTGGWPPVVHYEAGTLVLDIMDARTGRIIWRGWARNAVQDLLDDPDRMADTINESVTRMLSRLPPARQDR